MKCESPNYGGSENHMWLHNPENDSLSVCYDRYNTQYLPDILDNISPKESGVKIITEHGSQAWVESLLVVDVK